MAIGDAAQANMMIGGQGAAFQQMFVGALIDQKVSIFGAQRVADGAASAGLTVPLPLNAVVKTFDVVVQAQQADFTPVKAVAQLRDANQEVMGGDGMAVVIDFGTLRTAAAVQVPAGLQVFHVTPWIGMGFAPTTAYSVSSVASSISPGGQVSTSVQAPDPSTGQLAYFKSEVRTERLLVSLIGSMSIAELAEQMSVLLPEAPSGLELHLEGGATVWSHPAPPQLTDATALSDAAWNKDGRRIVHAAPTLAAVTGDPTASQSVDFTLTLTSRVPGVLSVTEHARDISFIRRVLFDGDPARTLDFPSEGAIDLPLVLPPPGAGQSRAIEAVRFTAIATPPPERVLPPVGPDPAGGAGVPVLSDLVVSADKAAIVRLRPGTGLAELTAIRLPLATGADGAEARVVLWRNKGPGLLEPLDVMEGATSDPVVLQGGEAWVTFSFPRPVEFQETDPPWAALLVSRGEASWSLGASTGAADPFDANIVRLGAPTGPWKPLPAPFQTAGSPLAALRGRVRMVGLAPKDDPLAPMRVSAVTAAGPAIEVTPTPKGAAVAIAFDPPLPVAQPTLRIVSLCAGAVTLRDVDVVSTS